MAIRLFQCSGGDITLPNAELVLVSREDGGNLVVNPPRPVWERSELTPEELKAWSCLVAAAGHAMLSVLPQLEGGCVNYWEAGNWALHPLAEPKGDKSARDHRSVHLHLLGRSRTPANSHMQWGEAPSFPRFEQRHEWAASHKRLTPEEAGAIVDATEHRLLKFYRFDARLIAGRSTCEDCGYPSAAPFRSGDVCTECAAAGPNTL